MVSMSADNELADLSCVEFNQDGKSLSVGHANGYLLYTTTNCAEASKLESDGDSDPKIHDAVIVERLFSSSLVVIVSRQQPRCMYVYHSQSRNMICDHKYMNTVLNVKLNRERVVVCLEDNIYIYNLKDMKLMHSVCDTPKNKHGLIDLCPASSCYLAYPGSDSMGNVHIFDAMHLKSLNTFVAHNSPLAALKFNNDGTKLATAGSKGTVIRVFAISSGQKLFEFRRGISRCATIYSMFFSADSTYLCTSSNTPTVHVFKLEKPTEKEESKQPTSSASATATSGWFDYIQQTAAAYLPTQVSDLSLLERSFAYAHLPSPGAKNVSALPTINGQPHLLVATTEGFLYCYRIEPDGGECQLVKQHRIGPIMSGSGGPVVNLMSPSGKASPSGSVSSTRSGASRTGSGSNAPAAAASAPDIDDAGDFPPMSHTSG